MVKTPDIGIKETKEVIKAIYDVYHVSFEDYALTSFMRRLNKVMEIHHFRTPDQLIFHLKQDPGFFDRFLKEISVETTEMFRDPSLWRFFINEIIPNVILPRNNYKIWLPSCVSGEELFSLLIILKEEKVLDQVEIIAGTSNTYSQDIIQKGLIKKEKLRLSEENYIRIHGREGNLEKYYHLKPNYFVLDNSLLQNVRLSEPEFHFTNIPDSVDLILYRNTMLYYNFALKDRVLNTLYSSLKQKGLLVIGTKETIASHDIAKQVTYYTPFERIYQKK